MATSIIPQSSDMADELIRHYATVLADFDCRMGVYEAARKIGIDHHELTAAINQGQLRYYKVGKGGKRVSPMFLAEYIEKYRTGQEELLPG